MINFATETMKTYLRQAHISGLLLTKLDFVSGDVCVHSGVGQIEYDGQVYLGVGALGKIGNVTQNGKVQPNKLSLTLSGIPPSLVSTALTEEYQNRSGVIYLAALNMTTGRVQAADILFQGRMDVMTVSDGAKASIKLEINSRGVDWKNARNGRYTHADHQARESSDDFFEFVSESTERELQWGVPGGKSTTSSGGGSGSSSSGRRVNRV
ncbi:hypothetical protein [uncultured Shewanella sp.]|uniref:hypothetical protein n=1 Tax=uncultured Shewanella sp. TaxID=173975 RepID=UPI00262CE940|nr:hypothetical protein [uncultured Shewanella sp.]